MYGISIDYGISTKKRKNLTGLLTIFQFYVIIFPYILSVRTITESDVKA